MSFKSDLKLILARGLPALLEKPTAAPADPQPEKIPPEPQLKDREAFALGNVGVTKNQALVGGAALLGVVALVFIARSL